MTQWKMVIYESKILNLVTLINPEPLGVLEICLFSSDFQDSIVPSRLWRLVAERY